MATPTGVHSFYEASCTFLCTALCQQLTTRPLLAPLGVPTITRRATQLSDLRPPHLPPLAQGLSATPPSWVEPTKQPLVRQTPRHSARIGPLLPTDTGVPSRPPPTNTRQQPMAPSTNTHTRIRAPTPLTSMRKLHTLPHPPRTPSLRNTQLLLPTAQAPGPRTTRKAPITTTKLTRTLAPMRSPKRKWTAQLRFGTRKVIAPLSPPPPLPTTLPTPSSFLARTPVLEPLRTRLVRSLIAGQHTGHVVVDACYLEAFILHLSFVLFSKLVMVRLCFLIATS